MTMTICEPHTWGVATGVFALFNSVFFSTNSLCNFIRQVAFYTGGSRLEWREVETGLPLPSTSEVHSSILAWEPSSETWRRAGDLAVATWKHAAVAVSSSDIDKSECSIPTLWHFILGVLLYHSHNIKFKYQVHLSFKSMSTEMSCFIVGEGILEYKYLIQMNNVHISVSPQSVEICRSK